MDRLTIGRDNTYISFPGLDGHVSILPGTVTSEPRSADTIRGTELPLETTAEILGKKLVFRIARQQIVVAQDLYDIAWAERHAAADLNHALQAVHPLELPDVLQALDDHVRSRQRLARLLRPADPALERMALDIVRQLVRDHVRLRGRDRPPDP